MKYWVLNLKQEIKQIADEIATLEVYLHQRLTPVRLRASALGDECGKSTTLGKWVT